MKTKAQAAQAALDAAQAAMDAHMKAELDMCERITALDAEEKRLKESIANAKASLVNAMAAGNTKATATDVTAAQAKLEAIAEARARFPHQLQTHRDRGMRIGGRLHAAQTALKTAHFDDAVLAYREAMAPIWPLAEKVWEAARATGFSHLLDLPGMADPGSKFGRLSA